MENKEETLQGILVSCVYSKKNNRSYISIMVEADQTSYFKGLDILRCSFEGPSVFNKLNIDDFYKEVSLVYNYKKSSFSRDLTMNITDIILDTGESLVK